MLIAVLGAPGTGKTTLVDQLGAALPGLTQLRISEVGGPAAVQQAGSADLVLLTALDLPCPEAFEPAQARVDAQLRSALVGAGIAWSVITGLGEDRLAQALAAVRRALAAPEPSPPSRWQWHCDHCDDPDCERRRLPRLTP